MKTIQELEIEIVELVSNAYLRHQELAVEDFIGQLYIQPYCWNKSMFYWRRLKWVGKMKRKNAMTGISDRHITEEQNAQTGKTCLSTGKVG